MAWEVPDRRFITPWALGLLPDSAQGFPPLAETVPPGDFRPDRSRWPRQLTLQQMGQRVEQTTLLGGEDTESTLYISFLGKVCSGGIPGFLGREQSFVFLQKNVINHGSS